MCQLIKRAIVVLVIFIGTLNADDLFVSTPSGPIRGTTIEGEISDPTKIVYVYYGIPYAEAPVGDLRFRPPVEKEPWENELDATNPSPACYQQTYDSHVDPESFSEDCLNVNIYVRKPRPANATVLVYIHQGSIINWHPIAQMAYGTVIATLENLIVVTVHSRNTVHGYLHLGIPEAPGNVGLMDQQMALRWVRHNIASFGGNPDNVVISGTSDVGIHLLLPGSSDLFKRAMLDIGTPNALWAMNTKEDALESSKNLAKSLGCGSDNPKDVLQCMQSVSTRDLSDWKRMADLHFVPTVDGTFISDDPMKLLSKENAKFVDVIIGNQHDVSLLSRLVPGIREDPPLGITEEQFLSGVDSILKKYDNLTRKIIASLYTNWTGTEDPLMWREALEDLLFDYYFHCPANEYTDLYLTAKSTVYRYAVDFREYIRPDADIDLEGLTRRWFRWIANFARTGNPNGVGQSGPTWRPSTLENNDYMRYRSDLVMDVKFRTKECAMVKKIISVIEENQQQCHK